MNDRLNSKVTNVQLQQASKKLEIGWMGIAFGDTSEKAGNVAALTVILSFAILLCVLFFLPGGENSGKTEAMTLLGSTLTGALGFLFGRPQQSN
jgi:lipoprotein signal peptidase